MSTSTDAGSGGLHFEEFVPGRTWTSAARVVTQDGVDRFAALLDGAWSTIVQRQPSPQRSSEASS